VRHDGFEVVAVPGLYPLLREFLSLGLIKHPLFPPTCMIARIGLLRPCKTAFPRNH
jgi:hypothetical protein